MPRAEGTVEGIADVEHSSVEALAKAIGRTRQTVHEWFLAGCPHAKPYSEVLVRQWASAAGIDGLSTPSAAVAALLGRAPASPRASSAALERVRDVNEQLLQVQLAKELRQLVTAVDAEGMIVELTAAWLEVLVDLPDQVLAAIAAARPELVVATLRGPLDQVLRGARQRMADAAPRILRARLGAAPPAVSGSGGHP